MTDTKSTARTRAAGGGTWALPLLALAPAAAIDKFTDHATPWLVISWVCCALAAVLLAAGWSTVFRNGMRNAGSWATCILAHAVLAIQLIWLVRH
ncbi:hypothetical protein AB0D66_18880 [Streptomyces sp. NPDC048270]|uniref:hypothetical protein n=1 Tax=Streptomyces sp. NPDC048270 TaxID=3154615 RepID=UPI0033C571BD